MPNFNKMGSVGNRQYKACYQESVCAAYTQTHNSFSNSSINNLGDIIDLAVRHPEFLEPPIPAPRSISLYTIVYRETKAVCKRHRLLRIFGATDYIIYIFWVAGVVPLLYLFINTIIIGRGLTIWDGGFQALNTDYSALHWLTNISFWDILEGVVIALHRVVVLK